MTKRKKSLIFSALIIGVPIIAFLIINGILVHQSDREVERRLEAIRAAGDPVTLADFPTDADIPPEEDARAMLESISDLCYEIHVFASSYDEQSEGLPETWGEEASLRPLPMWPPESTDPPRKFDDPMPVIRKAAAAKGWKRAAIGSGSLLDWYEAADSDGWDALDRAAEVLHHHFNHCTSKAQWIDAADDMIAILRLTELYHRVPTHRAREVMVQRRRAFEGLATLLQRKDAEPALVDRIEAGLPEIPFDDILRESIIRARASYVTHSQRDSALGNLWLARFLSNRILLKELDDAETLLGDPGTIRDWASEPRPYDVTIRGSLAWYWDGTAADRALLRSLRILIALKRMDDPDSLVAPDDTLDPTKLGLSAETTTDPHTGTPLIVRKKDAGWLIYSVGSDENDDLGDIHGDMEYYSPNRDVGIAPPPEETP